MDNSKTCTECNGTGIDADWGSKCYPCAGAGKIEFVTKPIAEVIPPTDKQLAFMTNLENQKGMGAQRPAGLTKATASQWIDTLLAAKKAVQGAPKVGITEGYWVLDGQIIKVQQAKNGSGNLYAKRLVGTTFEYAAGLIGKMANATLMTPADAKAFGDLYGRCFKCGADLTDEISIERGVGPVCYKKMGW